MARTATRLAAPKKTRKADIAFATFNLYNLQSPDKPWRQGKSYSEVEYQAKIGWTAHLLRRLDADVIAFQELWSAECLFDAFKAAGLDGDYQFWFIKEDGVPWYDIAVAVAVRRPWTVRHKAVHKAFPEGFELKKRAKDGRRRVEDEDDDIEVKIDKFSRSVLQLSVVNEDVPGLPAIEAFAVHLKSKLPTMLDKQEREKPKVKSNSAPLGAAISTIRRVAESAALRILLTDVMKGTDVPVAVLGDYNDGPDSNALAIVTSQPSLRLHAAERKGARSDAGLYSAGVLHELTAIRDVNFTHIFNGVHESLDHVLVSEQFYDHSKNRIWSLGEFRVFNDHVEDVDSATSDHGLVVARFDHNPA